MNGTLVDIIIDIIVGLTAGIGICFLCTSQTTQSYRSGANTISKLLANPTLVGGSISLITSLFFLCSCEIVVCHSLAGLFIGHIIHHTMHLWTTKR